MYPSQKFKDFVKEPMRNKSVKMLPGIGDTLGKRLIDKGYVKAYKVMGKFLYLNKDEELFKDWISESIGTNSKQAGEIYDCLKTWCDNYL